MCSGPRADKGSFRNAELIRATLPQISRQFESEIAISEFKAPDRHENRGYQQRTHRYLWGEPSIATPPRCTATSSTRHVDLVAAEVEQAGSRRPLTRLAAEWPTTQLGRSPRRPCPVAGPEGVRWESNFGVVCLESQAEVSNRLPVKKNQQFPDFLMPAVPLRRGGGGDRRAPAKPCRRI